MSAPREWTLLPAARYDGMSKIIMGPIPDNKITLVEKSVYDDLEQKLAKAEAEIRQLSEDLAYKTNHANAMKYSFDAKHKKCDLLETENARLRQAFELERRHFDIDQRAASNTVHRLEIKNQDLQRLLNLTKNAMRNAGHINSTWECEDALAEIDAIDKEKGGEGPHQIWIGTKEIINCVHTEYNQAVKDAAFIMALRKASPVLIGLIEAQDARIKELEREKEELKAALGEKK